MKLLSPDHVVVIMRLDHPVYGTLVIDRFQRTEESIKVDLHFGNITWQSGVHKITRNSEFISDERGWKTIFITVEN